MEVAALSPLPVGLLAWSSPDPTHTVIVKATYAFAGSGHTQPSATQLPMSLDVASRHGGGGLDYASDFAPQKRGVDVLIVGHARAATPSRTIPLRVAVGSLDLRLYAVSEQPSDAIALDTARVRRVPQDPSSAVRLGPAAAAVRGWMSRTVQPGFDFSAFNSAPLAHRLEQLRPPFAVALEGLAVHGESRTIQIPDVEPRIFLVDARQLEGRAVTLQCDTMWIDTDHQQLALIWRGSFPRVDDARLSYLAVAMQRSSLALEWSELVPQLPGARWRPAVGPGDLQTDHRLEAATPVPAGPLVASHLDIPLDPNDDDPPTLAAFRPPPSKPRDEETTGFYENLVPVGDSLPFKAPGSQESARSQSSPNQGQSPAPTAKRSLVDPQEATMAFVIPAQVEDDELVTEVGFDTATYIDDETTPPPTDLDSLGAALPFRSDEVATGPQPAEERPNTPNPSSPSQIDDTELEEEPAPITPRAGMMLGGGQGFALGGATLGQQQQDKPLPFGVAPPSETSGRAAPNLRAGLPFGHPSEPGSSAAALEPKSAVGRETLVDPGEVAGGPATPFQPASSGRANRTLGFPAVPPSAPTPWSGDRVGGDTATEDDARTALDGALPFVRPGVPAAAPAPPPQPRGPQFIPRPPQPLSRPSAPAASPTSSAHSDRNPTTTAARSISLQTYASVKAALWDGDLSLAEVLADEGIDEADWNAHERSQAVALAKDASSGKGELARKVRAAILEARRQRGADDDGKEMPLADYAELKVEVEEADEPAAVLRARGLNAEAWEQLQRRWAHRAKSDSAIARELRGKLAAARRAAAERA